MKRDMELVRKILLTIEEKIPNDRGGIFDIEGYEHDVAGYHVKWLKAEDLIEARINTYDGGMSWAATDLTPKGHDFLAKMRDESVWKRVVGQIKDTGGAVSLAVVEALLTKAATDLIK